MKKRGTELNELEVSPNTHPPIKNSPRQQRGRLNFDIGGLQKLAIF